MSKKTMVILIFATSIMVSSVTLILSRLFVAKDAKAQATCVELPKIPCDWNGWWCNYTAAANGSEYYKNCFDTGSNEWGSFVNLYCDGTIVTQARLQSYAGN